MSNNPLLKSLKAFNPKADLEVDESFAAMINSMDKDTLSDLEGEGVAGHDGDSGKEFGAIRTGGPIDSGCIALDLDGNRRVIACANKKGEIFYFEPKGESLAVTGKVSLQGTISQSPVFSDGIIRITSYNVCYTKLLRMHISASKSRL